MAITVEARTSIIELVVGMFNAAPGASILSDLVVAAESGSSINQIAANLAATQEFKSIFPTFLTNDEYATKVVDQLLSQATDTAKAEAVTVLTAELNGGMSRVDAMITAINYVNGVEATNTAYATSGAAFDNKVAVAIFYSVDAQNSGSSLSDLQNVISGVTNTAASVTAAKASITNTANEGSTFTLTTGIDNVVGTSGNDVIIADNSGAAATKTVSAGDQINGGAGTDKLKFYADAAVDIATQVLPQISSVETLYIKGGLATNATTLNVSTMADVTSVEVDTPAAVLANTADFAVKTTAAQTVTLSNVNTGTGDTATVSLTAATDVTVNGVGADSTDNGTVQIDVESGTATSAKITASGASSKVTLLNTGAKLETLNIAGDKSLTLVESLAGLKTIDASTATGSVSVNTSGIATLASAFKFTGGAGGDTLRMTQASLEGITAGAQLNAGTAGFDILAVSATNLTFNAAATKVINNSTGFDALALYGTTTSIIDASTLTSIKAFVAVTGTNTISKIDTGSTVVIAGATTKTTVSGAVGVNDLTVNIGTAASTTATTNTALDITGLNNVTINASIKAGVTGASHTLGTLTNSDNSTFTINGNGDLTFALAAATTTGSRVDGSAATGVLNITGNSAALDGAKASLGDVLIGGSAADTIVVGANSSVLTGNAGNDSFDVKAAVSGATTPITSITDFTKGDKLLVEGNAAVLEKVDLSGLATGKTDAEVITALATAATTAVNDVAWGNYNGNTYVFNEVATAGSVDATDIAVKLVGVLDLATSDIATGTITFA